MLLEEKESSIAKARSNVLTFARDKTTPLGYIFFVYINYNIY